MKKHIQLIRFSLVGLLNTLLHVGILGSMTQLIGLSQLISNSVAYLVASSFSFIVNSIWSFRVKPAAYRFARFQIVGLLGLSVCAFIGHLGDLYGWHYVITVLLTGVAVPLFSFFAHRSYTFSR
jgi:putative flippase GtrA